MRNVNTMKFTNFAIGLLVMVCHVLNGAESANILSLVEVLAPDQQIWYILLQNKPD